MTLIELITIVALSITLILGVYVYRHFTQIHAVTFFPQSRGQFCYGEQESARRREQITDGRLSYENGLERHKPSNV